MKPNIVIIVWDAVRAKNLSLYGYDRNTTPNLLNMSKELAIYRNAISSSYWTLPSITSLFTGMYPSSHRLVVEGEKLSPQFMTLAELLRQQGYTCASFNRNPYISNFTGLDRGFHYMPDSRFMSNYWAIIENKLNRIFSQDHSTRSVAGADLKSSRPGETMVRMLKHLPDIFTDCGSRMLVRTFRKWLNRLERRPFFAFFQALEAHSPYRAPMGFGLKFLTVRDLYRKILINQDNLAYALGKSRLDKNHFQILQNAYDNSIRYCDFITHRICQILKTKGLYENTLIVVMSDHGESIGEHNLMFHIWSLYDHLIKVPLIVKYPRGVSVQGVVEQIVQNIDIFPTILSLINGDSQFPWNQMQGNSLLDDTFVNRETDIAISELIKPFGPDKIGYRRHFYNYDRRLVSLRTTDKKLIYSSRGDHEFYDLKQDPEETDNLYGRLPEYAGLDELAISYYKKMDEFYQSHKDRIESDESLKIEDDNIREKLKQLGYL